MIYLIPIEAKNQPIDPGLLESICEAVHETFQQDCQIEPGMPAPERPNRPETSQYSAEALLTSLPEKEGRVLGVADLDLYAPGLNFVFGLADSVTHRAVIALPRLRNSFYEEPEDKALFTERAIKEAIHEFGHTFGLGHCSDPRCVMHFSNTLAETDFKSRELCATDAEMLKQVLAESNQ